MHRSQARRRGVWIACACSLLAAFGTFGPLAQPGGALDGLGLSGVLTDQATGLPLEGATVEIWLTSASIVALPFTTTTTSATGRWEVGALETQGPYRIRFEKPGYLSRYDAGATAWADASAVTAVLAADLNQRLEDSLAPGDEPGPPVFDCADVPGPGDWIRLRIDITCTVADPATVIGQPTFTLQASIGNGHETTTAMSSTRRVRSTAVHCTTYGPLGPFSIDASPPTVLCDTVPKTWSPTNISIPCTGTAVGAPLVGGPIYYASTNTPDGVGGLTFAGPVSICDVVGQCVSGSRNGAMVDRSVPTATCAGVPSVTAWLASVSFTCTIHDTGSGPVAPTSRPVSVALPAGEQGTVAMTPLEACDKVANCTSGIVPVGPFMIDHRAPTITCPAADDQWHATNVTVHCAAADDGAGLATTSGIAFGVLFSSYWIGPDVALTTQVAANTENGNVSTASNGRCDLVKNCSPAVAVSGLKVDRKAPVVTITAPIDGASVPLGAAVTVGYSCADGGSGVATCVGSVPFGSALDTSTLGPKTITITAVDAVGNTSGPVTTTYTVIAPNVTTPISGTLTDSVTGLPAAKVSVRLYALGSGTTAKTTLTDAAGRYHFSDVPEGTYQLQYLKSGVYNARWYAGLATRAGAAPIVVDGFTTTTADDTLVPTAPPTLATIGGVVVDTDAATVAGATVTVYVSGTSTVAATTTTASDGTWSATVAPDSYQVKVAAAGFSIEWYLDAPSQATALPVTLAANTTTPIVVQLDRPAAGLATISGTVRADTGAPIAGAAIKIYATGATTWVSAKAAADGTYSFQLAPGSYELQFSAGGYLARWWDAAANRAKATSIIVASGGSATADMVLSTR